MPIYQYQCDECGHRFDALQKMSDPVLQDCPECQRPALKKQVTAAAFKLKGTGWYETDFKNSGKPAKKTGSDDKKTSSDNTADTKSADKPVANTGKETAA